jgi:hypothetical protein
LKELTRWRAELDQILPEQGEGADVTLRVLRDVAIPHGSRAGAPGFAGRVTIVSAVAPMVACFSRMIYVVNF